MYKTIKIFIILFSTLALPGCRTTKPTVVVEESTDSLKLFTTTSICMLRDSVYFSEESTAHTDEMVRFVESGGDIYVSADGRIVLSGVVGVKHSNSHRSERLGMKDSLSLQSQSADFIAKTHQSISHSESKTEASSWFNSWKMKCGALVLFILMIVILTLRIKRSINHS